MQIRAAFISMCNFILMILVLQSCQSMSMVRPVILNSDLRPPIFTHYDLYVSKDFDVDEVDLIESAAQEWENKTHGLASFDIYYNFDVKDYSVIKNKKEALVVLKLSKYSDWVMKVDKAVNGDSGARIVGYYNTDDDFPTPTIVLVYDRMTGSFYEKGCFLHELGHAEGLGHLQEPNTLMYPSMDLSSRDITHSDLVAFCAIHYCDVRKLD